MRSNWRDYREHIVRLLDYWNRSREERGYNTDCKMDVLRKRRASIELQELMNAVKTDYEFFTQFDTMLEHRIPAAKRQRSLSDNVLIQHDIRRSKRVFDLMQTNNRDRSIWMNQRHSSMTHKDLVCLPESQRASRLPPRSLRDLLIPTSGNISENAERAQIRPRLTRIGPPSSPPTAVSPCSEAWPELTAVSVDLEPSQPCVSRDDIYIYPEEILSRKPRLGSQVLFHKAVLQPLEVIAEETHDDVFEVRRRFAADKDRRQKIAADQSSDQPIVTKILYGGLPLEKATVHENPAKVRRASFDRELHQKQTVRSIRPEKFNSTAMPPLEITRPSNEYSVSMISKTHMNVRQTTPSPTKLDPPPNDRLQTDNSPSHKESEKSPREVIPVGCLSPEDRSPTSSMSLSPPLLPNYVITRVGSLLWLGRDVVYPITLDEIRRRVQDPENFSFQMLIAYVRHSRAKGRQFLDYWKCQPTGKTSRPNVLSKLCEADARGLVEGIQRVNDEYFPGEKLARTAAENFLDDLRKNTGADNAAQVAPQEQFIQDKVERIERSRSVFKTLQKTLLRSQYDEKLATFNIASHNAGLANIKNNLTFLDGLLEKIQTHIKRGHRNYASFTS